VENPPDTPQLAIGKPTDAAFRIEAGGSWTAGNAAALEETLSRVRDGARGNASVSVHMEGVDAFDTYGAWLLERLRRELESDGAQVTIEGMPQRRMPLFREMAEVNREEDAALRKARPPLGGEFSFTGLISDIVGFVVMLGAAVQALARIVFRPRSFRFTSTVHQFDRVGWQALPIVILVTFIIGAIIAQQGFFHFRRFGADLYVVDMVGFLVMREIGVLLVAIMVAGRSGSSFTAELGSMKMREEIDALRTMGFDPVEVLILPRILVLVVALPVLTFIGSMAALYGAGLVATFYAGMSWELYVDRLRDAITIEHFQVGLIKAPFIGLVIGVIACNEGLLVRGSASSLGLHTTRSVVKSIFMVIVVDGFFAVFFSAIGM
jgi:phospholipid/cholesterol/gamma-HCH transport system permease protein